MGSPSDRDALASCLAAAGIALGVLGVALWLPLGWAGVLACLVAVAVAP